MEEEAFSRLTIIDKVTIALKLRNESYFASSRIENISLKLKFDLKTVELDLNQSENLRCELGNRNENLRSELEMLENARMRMFGNAAELTPCSVMRP